MASQTGPRAPRTAKSWILTWDPEDEDSWNNGGRRTARRNLWASIASEHIGFSIWSIWSILVLFMTPEHGFSTTPEQKFLLLSVVTLVGALLRVPYTLAVPLFGGRNWTIVSTLMLTVPTIAALLLIRAPTPPSGSCWPWPPPRAWAARTSPPPWPTSTPTSPNGRRDGRWA